MQNTSLKPIALLPLLVRVRTAPSVQHQMDLLLRAGEFRSLVTHPVSEREKLKICGSCGSVTTPFGSCGDVLELEFILHGFKVIYRTREIWEGGRRSLSELLKDPELYFPSLNRTLDRLRLKGIPKAIRPMLPKVRNMVALASIGLASYPGIPGHAAPSPEAKTNSVSVEGRKPGEPSDFSSFWIPVRATSYCWQEPDHAPYGQKNCMGGDLTKPVEGLFQCAADLSVYPLGTILCIKIDDVEEFRIVTDCGKAVKGAHHLDLHFNTLAEMDAKGTQHALIMVIRRGWTSQETLP